MDEHLLERESDNMTRSRASAQACVLFVLMLAVHVALLSLAILGGTLTPEHNNKTLDNQSLAQQSHMDRLWVFNDNFIA